MKTLYTCGINVDSEMPHIDENELTHPSYHIYENVDDEAIFNEDGFENVYAESMISKDDAFLKVLRKVGKMEKQFHKARLAMEEHLGV